MIIGVRGALQAEFGIIESTYHSGEKLQAAPSDKTLNESRALSNTNLVLFLYIICILGDCDVATPCCLRYCDFATKHLLR